MRFISSFSFPRDEPPRFELESKLKTGSAVIMAAYLQDLMNRTLRLVLRGRLYAIRPCSGYAVSV
jgi:hypothetical protein